MREVFGRCLLPGSDAPRPVRLVLNDQKYFSAPLRLCVRQVRVFKKSVLFLFASFAIFA